MSSLEHEIRELERRAALSIDDRRTFVSFEFEHDQMSIAPSTPIV